MTNEKFLDIVEDLHKYRINILSDSKKKRTASSDDRLIQFKRMAALRKCTVKSAAIDLCTKQFTDLIDMADETHQCFRDIEYLKDLAADVKNYLDILVAIAMEEEQEDGF
jgi:hypothetical protein